MKYADLYFDKAEICNFFAPAFLAALQGDLIFVEQYGAWCIQDFIYLIC